MKTKVTLGKAATSGTLDPASLRQQFATLDTAHMSALARRYQRNALQAAADGHNFTSEYAARMPQAMFVLMPIFALLAGLVYRSRRRPYAAHLIVALHLHAFAFTVMTVIALSRISWAPHALRLALAAAGVVWLLAYVPRALRCVYGGRWLPTLVRSAVLGATYAAALILTLGVVGAYFVYTYHT